MLAAFENAQVPGLSQGDPEEVPDSVSDALSTLGEGVSSAGRLLSPGRMGRQPVLGRANIEIPFPHLQLFVDEARGLAELPVFGNPGKENPG